AAARRLFPLALPDALPTSGGDELPVLAAHLDVELQPVAAGRAVLGAHPRAGRDRVAELRRLEPARLQAAMVAAARHQPVGERARSEEHTSELQSRENLVCR